MTFMFCYDVVAHISRLFDAREFAFMYFYVELLYFFLTSSVLISIPLYCNCLRFHLHFWDT